MKMVWQKLDSFNKISRCFPGSKYFDWSSHVTSKILMNFKTYQLISLILNGVFSQYMVCSIFDSQ